MPAVKEVIQRRLKGVRGHVAVAIWQEDDVIGVAQEHGVVLSHKSAAEILDTIDNKQDCSIGIHWETLHCYIIEWKREHPHYRRLKEEQSLLDKVLEKSDMPQV